jgi:hypothetical protein
MPRTVVPVTALARTGVAAPTEQNGDITNGHVVANSGRTEIVVRNADAAGAHSVTFVTPGTVDGLAVADRTVSIPISSTVRFGRLPTGVYGSQLGIDVDSAQLKLLAFEP